MNKKILSMLNTLEVLNVLPDVDVVKNPGRNYGEYAILRLGANSIRYRCVFQPSSDPDHIALYPYTVSQDKSKKELNATITLWDLRDARQFVGNYFSSFDQVAGRQRPTAFINK